MLAMGTRMVGPAFHHHHRGLLMALLRQSVLVMFWSSGKTTEHAAPVLQNVAR